MSLPATVRPDDQQEKAEAAREARRADDGGGGDERSKREQKETVGVPVQPNNTQDYRFVVTFVDTADQPYTVGTFTMTLTFFELGTPRS